MGCGGNDSEQAYERREYLATKRAYEEPLLEEIARLKAELAETQRKLGAVVMERDKMRFRLDAALDRIETLSGDHGTE